MRVIREDWETALSVRDAAAWFKATAQNRHDANSRAAKFVARQRLEFFTPTGGDDPFARFEGQPDFAAGVTMPRGGGFLGSGEVVTLHMYVFDAGASRELQFTTPVASAMDQFTSGRVRGVGHSPGSSKKLLRHFLDMLQHEDRNANRLG